MLLVGGLQVGDDIVLTIVGNKSDLEKQRAVSQEEAAAFAQFIGAQHVSASAKTGQGIEAAVSGTTQTVLAGRKRRGGSARPPGSTGVCFCSKLVITQHANCTRPGVHEEY